jgi:hypothetical protein
MKALHKVMAALAAGAAFAVPAVSQAQVHPGTTLVGTLDRELDSKSTQVGQPFKLLNVNSHAYEINGATAYGHVAQVQSGGAGRKAELKLVVDKINTRSGNIYKIVGYTTDVKVNTKSNAGREAGGAAAGALVGGLIGGGWGAVIGGTGGFLVSKNVHQNVMVPQGSLVTVQIAQSRKQASHP